MHRAETIDDGIVLEGERTLILDVAKTRVQAGDVVIQREPLAARWPRPC